MAFKWINLTYDVLNKTANASAADFDVRPNKTVGVNFPFDAPGGADRHKLIDEAKKVMRQALNEL